MPDQLFLWAHGASPSDFYDIATWMVGAFFLYVIWKIAARPHPDDVEEHPFAESDDLV